MAMVLSAGCADRLMLLPSTRRVDPSGATCRPVPFGDGHLDVWVARTPACAAHGPAVFDVELVGNGSRAAKVAGRAARRWGGRAVEVWAVDWPGFGGSTGPASMAAIAPAALAGYDAAAAVAAGRPVVIDGHSLGTAAALYVAARRPAAGLVLLNPPPLRQLVVGYYGWWNLWLGAIPVSLQIPPDLDSLANGPRDAAPAVFVTSGSDRVVPPRYQRLVIAAYRGPKRIVVQPSAGHDAFPDPARDDTYARALDWLFDQVASPPRLAAMAAARRE